MEKKNDTMQTSEIVETKRADRFFIDPRLIVVEEGFNTREDFDLDDILPSIIENGVKVALTCYKEGDKYYLKDGERRYRAVMKAISMGHNIVRVPVITEKKTSIEERTFEILIRNSGKPLNPLELANTYLRLQTYGHTPDEIAKKIGKSVVHVYEMLKVAEMPKKVKEFIRNQNVTATQALTIKAALKDEGMLAEALTDAVDKHKDRKNVTNQKTKKITKNNIDPKFMKQVEKLQPDIPYENFSEFVNNLKLSLGENNQRKVDVCVDNLFKEMLGME